MNALPPVIPAPNASPRPAARPARRGPSMFLTILGLSFLLVAVAAVLVIWGVISYFRVGADVRALRDGFQQSAPGAWSRNIEINVGPFTTGLVRSVLVADNQMEPEARAALNSVQAGQVGVYELAGDARLESAAAFAAADRAMSRRGWDRLVAVVQGDNQVVVYAPLDPGPGTELSLCFAVLHERQLIVGQARADLQMLEPLLRNLGRQFAPANGPAGAEDSAEPTPPAPALQP